MQWTADSESDSLLPPRGLCVRLAAGVLVRQGGRVLCGGEPVRLIQLSDAGAHVVARWDQGAPVGEQLAQRRLARRLLDAGLLIPDPAFRLSVGDLAVVVPVHDQPDELDRCLAALRRVAPAADLVVVDDGSREYVRIESIASVHGARLVRHETAEGAGVARNTGESEVTRPFVAFVDADVVVEPGCLQRLVAHFDDPQVAAAAPRIGPLARSGFFGSYEARHSSLDLGGEPSTVAPGQRVSFVPTAVLVMRRSMMPPGGFNGSLPIGEDVDFVWRLRASGYRVIYDPSVSALHDHRTRPRPFFRRRLQYARSIGLLARLHPEELVAMRADPITAAMLLAGLMGRFRSAGGLLLLRAALGWHGFTAAPSVGRDVALSLERRLLVATARSASHAVRRAWSPVLILWVHKPHVRLLLAAAYVQKLAEPAGPRRPDHVALCLADDAVAAAGTWLSCWQHRTWRPLTIGLMPFPRGGIRPQRTRRSRKASLAATD